MILGTLHACFAYVSIESNLQQVPRQLPDGRRICRWWGVGWRRAASNSVFQNKPQQSGFIVHDAGTMHASSAYISIVSNLQQVPEQVPDGRRICRWWGVGWRRAASNSVFQNKPQQSGFIVHDAETMHASSAYISILSNLQQVPWQLPDGRRVCRWWGVGWRRAASNSVFQNKPQQSGFIVHDAETMHACSAYVGIESNLQQVPRQLPDGRRICRWWGVGWRRAASNSVFQNKPQQSGFIVHDAGTSHACFAYVSIESNLQQVPRQLPDGRRICRMWGVGWRRAASNSVLQNKPQQSGFIVHDAETMHASSAYISILSNLQQMQ